MSEELREKLVEIWGLEEAPDGEKEVMLTRDADDAVIEGVSYAEEIDQTLDLITQELNKFAEAVARDVIGEDEAPDSSRPAGIKDGRRLYKPTHSLRASTVNALKATQRTALTAKLKEWGKV